MISTQYNHHTNPNFGQKIKLKKALPKIRQAINNTLINIDSPSKLRLQGLEDTPLHTELNYKLGFIRKFIDSLLDENGIAEFFRGQIGIVKAFKVANCSEYAEITKTTLKANKIKNCDVFALCAQKINSPHPPRDLDHVIVAIGIKKSQNNKTTQRPFIPKPKTKILDMYLDGFIGNFKTAKKRYKTFGLQPNEILMLKPIKILEPNKEALELVAKDFPSLIIN